MYVPSRRVRPFLMRFFTRMLQNADYTVFWQEYDEIYVSDILPSPKRQMSHSKVTILCFVFLLMTEFTCYYFMGTKITFYKMGEHYGIYTQNSADPENYAE